MRVIFEILNVIVFIRSSNLYIWLVFVGFTDLFHTKSNSRITQSEPLFKSKFPTNQTIMAAHSHCFSSKASDDLICLLSTLFILYLMDIIQSIKNIT